MEQSLLYWYYLTQYTFFLSGLVEQNVEQMPQVAAMTKTETGK